MLTKIRKPTQRHYYLFCDECDRLIKKYKITGWEVLYAWGAMGRKKDRSKLSTNFAEKLAIFHLGEEWKAIDEITDEGIKRLAKHEVIHLLICPLTTLGSSRSLDQNEYRRLKQELVLHLAELIE